MDNETKMFLGKVLGEVYKLQYNLNPDNCTVGPERIYGLINGIENAVQAELPTDFINMQEIRQIEDILHPYLYEGKPKPSFLGLKVEAEKEMIDEGKLITILTYLKANGQFSNLIQDFANEERLPTKFDIENSFS